LGIEKSGERVLKNGKIKEGYVFWNESWLSETVKNWVELRNKFPENFIEYNLKRNEIYLLTKLTIVKNDSLSEFKAITKEDEQIIQIDEILKIIEIEKDSVKYQGAGDIPRYTQVELDKLNTNPFATYQYNGSTSDEYFLSYNKKVTRQHLKKISESNEINREELIEMGVIVVSIGFD
jgi:hypothetical protein